jgi:hypothetical protein
VQPHGRPGALTWSAAAAWLACPALLSQVVCCTPAVGCRGVLVKHAHLRGRQPSNASRSPACCTPGAPATGPTQLTAEAAPACTHLCPSLRLVLIDPGLPQGCRLLDHRRHVRPALWGVRRLHAPCAGGGSSVPMHRPLVRPAAVVYMPATHLQASAVCGGWWGAQGRGPAGPGRACATASGHGPPPASRGVQ